MHDWIKIYRKFIEWEWYKDGNTFRLFIHCLLCANYKDGKFKNIDVPRGSFITSLEKLSNELGISIQSLRTSIKKLEKSENLTNKSYNKFRLITINNYDLYQSTNNQLTNNQQTTNKQLTTIEEYKNIRNIYNNNSAHAREEEPIYDYDWLNEED